MIHILLMILKIIGIVLLAVAGFLLLILLLTLFCPVVYRGRFIKNAERMAGTVSVTWLFRLVWVTVFYDNGERGFRIRILGIPLDAVGRLLAGWRNRKAKRSEAGRDSVKEKNDKPVMVETVEEAGTSKTAERPESEKSGEAGGKSGEAVSAPEKKPFFPVRIWHRIVSFFRMLAGLPKRIRRAVHRFFEKISDILKQTGRFRELLCSEEFAGALGLVRGSVGKILLHVRPGKIRGSLKFGFNDPSQTGMCLGAASIVYPWYHKTLTIEPDFQHKVLEADLYLRGQIFGVYMLYIFIKIYLDKNVKYLINRFRGKEAR